jgi:hypothetical protein
MGKFISILPLLFTAALNGYAQRLLGTATTPAERLQQQQANKQIGEDCLHEKGRLYSGARLARRS